MLLKWKKSANYSKVIIVLFLYLLVYQLNSRTGLAFLENQTNYRVSHGFEKYFSLYFFNLVRIAWYFARNAVYFVGFFISFFRTWYSLVAYTTIPGV